MLWNICWRLPSKVRDRDRDRRSRSKSKLESRAEAGEAWIGGGKENGDEAWIIGIDSMR
jgi:hypothetical protein